MFAGGRDAVTCMGKALACGCACACVRVRVRVRACAQLLASLDESRLSVLLDALAPLAKVRRPACARRAGRRPHWRVVQILEARTASGKVIMAGSGGVDQGPRSSEALGPRSWPRTLHVSRNRSTLVAGRRGGGLSGAPRAARDRHALGGGAGAARAAVARGAVRGTRGHAGRARGRLRAPRPQGAARVHARAAKRRRRRRAAARPCTRVPLRTGNGAGRCAADGEAAVAAAQAQQKPSVAGSAAALEDRCGAARPRADS